MPHMDEGQRPLACKACDGLGVRVVPQGGYLATCERCMGTGEADATLAAIANPPMWIGRRLAVPIPMLSRRGA